MEASKINQCGVLGVGTIGKAAEIVTNVCGQRLHRVFNLAGALFPGGMR
ncbi:MAG: hypothetical protein NWF02_04320 [Candidatus Bathyarchaeota archaeon]|nr:hypothetical protein [Candidatus Bathyarchaeum sp.]